jgi:hypothetical protein
MENPNYYAIITSNILFNSDLTDSEKILCAHISTLQKKNGYCYASNQYFSNITGVHKNTISRRLNRLKELGVLTIKIVHKKGSKEVESRLMKLSTLSTEGLIPLNAAVDTPKQNGIYPLNATVKDNIYNTNINKNNNIDKRPKSLDEVNDYFKIKNFDLSHAVDFYEYYESNGWKVGKNPMRKWKLAANRWVRNAKPKKSQSLSNRYFGDILENNLLE